MYCLHTSRTKPVQNQMRLNQALVFQTCTLYAFDRVSAISFIQYPIVLLSNWFIE